MSDQEKFKTEIHDAQEKIDQLQAELASMKDQTRKNPPATDKTIAVSMGLAASASAILAAIMAAM
jgi:cell division septum initiation protein DivIVA